MAARQGQQAATISDFNGGDPRDNGDRHPALTLVGREEASTTPHPSDTPGVTPSRQEPQAPWHAVTIDEVIALLATDPEQGLGSREATRRFFRSGPNTVELNSCKPPLPWWRSISWGMPRWRDRPWKWSLTRR